VVSVDARLKREAVFRAAFQEIWGGLCTLTGVREKPGGREKANKGKKVKGEAEGEEEKEKRKRKERETKKKEDTSGQYGCAFVKR
jgi:hypothetical protein